MRCNLPFNQPFRNLKDLASIHDHFLSLQANSTAEKPVRDPTSAENDNPHDGQVGCEQCRRTTVETWQCSFEKYFLREHTSTFKRQLQNFLEFARTISLPQNLVSQSTTPVDQLGSPRHKTVSTILREGVFLLPSDIIREFTQQLTISQDLERFLSYVLQISSQQIAIDIINISIDIWNSFRKYTVRFLERKQILQKVSQWVGKQCQSYFNESKIYYLNLRNYFNKDLRKKSGVFKKFNYFLKYYCTTILFIIGGYFQNPYVDSCFDLQAECIPDYPKRQSVFSQGYQSNNDDFSDSQEYDSFCKRQKI